MLIKRSGVDARVREEAHRRRESRFRKDLPTRGDYGFCREGDKNLRDMHRFKDPKDRAKIKAEYLGKQAEYRKNHVLGK